MQSRMQSRLRRLKVMILQPNESSLAGTDDRPEQAGLRSFQFPISLPDAKPAEDAVEDVVGVDFAGDRPQFVERVANFNRQQFLVRLFPGDGQGPVERMPRFL